MNNKYTEYVERILPTCVVHRSSADAGYFSALEVTVDIISSRQQISTVLLNYVLHMVVHITAISDNRTF